MKKQLDIEDPAGEISVSCEMENKPSVEATTNMTSGFEGHN